MPRVMTMVCVLVVGVALVVWADCGRPPKVVVARPMVRFVGPKGTSLFLVRGRGALRVTFTGNVGAAPFVCDSEPWLVDVSGNSASLRTFIQKLAFRKGHARAQLYDRDGKLLARGALCIFSTFKTFSKGIRKRYVIRIAPATIQAVRRRRQPAALFESYPPPTGRPNMVHIAWALYLLPELQ